MALVIALLSLSPQGDAALHLSLSILLFDLCLWLLPLLIHWEALDT